LWLTAPEAIGAGVEIFKPKPEETFHGNSGNVTMEIMARLDGDHTIRMLIDGERDAPDSRDPMFRLQDIDRSEYMHASGVDAG
jgi:hypothetical protein